MLIDDVPGDPTGLTSFADSPSTSVQDLTKEVKADGSLSWQPPPGDWEILRIGYTDSGARVSTSSASWQGLAIDYMSRRSFESYWRQSVEPLLIASKPYHSLKHLATDSWELGGANWTDDFQRDCGAPDVPVDAPLLKSWTEWNDPGIRYFSGTATYQAEVVALPISTGDRVWLRFSDLREIAHVTINGQDAGTVWAKPFTLRVDRFLKPGNNHLQIEVTNLWPNRIIGDLQPNAQNRFTSTNIKKYKADSPLLPSGLIGSLHWIIER